MSTLVSVKFQMPMIPASPEQQMMGTEALIPVQIRRVADRKDRTAGPFPLQTLLVPLRDGEAQVALEPGTYHLRTTLPNGDRLSDTVQIIEQEARQSIALQLPYNAPNEDSGWAYVLAEPQRRASRQASLMSKPSSFKLGRSRVSPQPNRQTPLEAFMTIGGSAVFGREVAERHVVPPVDPGDARLWNETQNGWQPQSSSQWLLRPQPFANDPNALVQWQGRVECSQRLWLELPHPGHASKFALIPPSQFGEHTRILLKNDQIDLSDADPINIIVETGGEASGVLLAYLHQGEIEAARAVGGALIDHAQSLLFNKLTDFTGAVIAAYFMHQYGPAGSKRPNWWPHWLKNLDEAFPAHSDGAVLRGWQLFHEGDVAGAAVRWVEASRRGLPLFTRGVRLLLDGLEMASSLDGGSTHAEVTIASVEARRAASTLDWAEITTTRWGRIVESGFVSAPCGRALE